MRTEQRRGWLAGAVGLVVAGAILPASAGDGPDRRLGSLHFGSSDVVPCALRAHEIDGSRPAHDFVHPALTCDQRAPFHHDTRSQAPMETAATWETSYADVGLAVGVVYRTRPIAQTEYRSMTGETVSVMGAVQYGPFTVGAGVFDAGGATVDTERRGYNLGANYRFGMLRVGTSLIATWSDGSWTGGSVTRRPELLFDSLSVDLEYMFTSGLTGYFNYSSAHHPDRQTPIRPDRSGQRESIWTIGVSLGF